MLKPVGTDGLAPALPDVLGQVFVSDRLDPKRRRSVRADLAGVVERRPGQGRRLIASPLQHVDELLDPPVPHPVGLGELVVGVRDDVSKGASEKGLRQALHW